jgi:nodulation protein E
MVGHLLGGAGAVAGLAAIGAIRDGVIPPTTSYEVPDPECDLDYVPNQARERTVRAAVSNSFAFGGLNAVLVVKRV